MLKAANSYLNLMLTDVATFKSRDEGQALIEYALIISLIAVVAISVLQLTGVHLKSLLTTIAGEV